jgi:hypothetical protein
MRSDTSAIVTSRRHYSGRDLSSFRGRLIVQLSHFVVDMSVVFFFRMMSDFSAFVIGQTGEYLRTDQNIKFTFIKRESN